jgi:predicted O-methyltransferase YrrM
MTLLINLPSAFQDALRYIDAFAHKYPDINIIEIGVGTGASTIGILDALAFSEQGNLRGNPSLYQRFSKYTFTDISVSFLEIAKANLQAHIDRMVFATLDIEKNPVEQGFIAGSYDLVFRL